MKEERSKTVDSSPSAGAGRAVSIRAYPYPYKAALAICNDLDGIVSFSELKAIHDVLNGRKPTPCGPGLGLEVGDSLHFYSVHPEQDDTLSYFQDASGKRSDYAGALRDGIASGLLDTLHTWGNYSQKGGFVREHAQRAVEELDRYGLRFAVWTNHGDIHNFQNLGRSDSLGDRPEVASSRGDRSTVLEYHADLARRVGIRYVWIRELTEVVGQERPLDPMDWWGTGISLGRDMLKGLLKWDGDDRSTKPLQIANRLIRPVALRDGSTLYEVLRFGSFYKDGGDQLPLLLTPQILRRLIEVRGAMLLYTHLGKGRPSPERPLSPESYQALLRLSQYAQDGDIWVTTPSRLCRYVELRQRLELWAADSGEFSVVRGEFHPLGDLSNPDLSGLAFYLPKAQSCGFRLGEEEFQLRRNPPDHTGTVSFTIPLEPIPYCWD